SPLGSVVRGAGWPEVTWLKLNCAAGPVSVLWMPTVAEPDPFCSPPYTYDRLFEVSYRTASKLATGVPPEQQYCARHSMMNWRFGAEPTVVVKMPWPPAVSAVYRSSQYGNRDLPNPAAGNATLKK